VGFGRATAAAFANQGMGVVLADDHDERLAEAFERIGAAGGEVAALHATTPTDERLDRQLRRLGDDACGFLPFERAFAATYALRRAEAID
jgi:NAD(P)-dependent dehydrogenase (short-subunit alcohol dehydrogenase family)